jgi:membrane protease YdiL (CAAX protease family)
VPLYALVAAPTICFYSIIFTAAGNRDMGKHEPSDYPTRDAARFFAVVYALTLPLWLLARRVHVSGLPDNLPITDAAATFVPLLSAIILVHREVGSVGVQRLLARLGDFHRFDTRSWLPLLLLTPAVYAVTYVTMHIAGLPVPQMRAPPPSLLLIFVAFFAAAAGEEIGYTGYLADRMLRHSSPLVTGLIIGVPWALWHLPSMIVIGQSPGLIAWGLAATVAFRVIYVWLYNDCGRSVFAVTLLHAIVNTGRTAFPSGRNAYELGDAAVGYGLIIMLALGIFVLRAILTTKQWSKD